MVTYKHINWKKSNLPHKFHARGPTEYKLTLLKLFANIEHTCDSHYFKFILKPFGLQLILIFFFNLIMKTTSTVNEFHNNYGHALCIIATVIPPTKNWNEQHLERNNSYNFVPVMASLETVSFFGGRKLHLMRPGK